MAQAKHVGKIVVSMENSAVSPVRMLSKSRPVSAKASYLIWADWEDSVWPSRSG
jgi:hypothetical protein